MIITRYLEIIPINGKHSLLINFLGGDAVIASNDEVDKLTKLELDDDELEYWHDRGYLFQTRKYEDDEVARLFELCKYAEHQFREPTGTIIPSYKCNCRCSYCFEGDITNQGYSITKPMVDKIFEILLDMRSTPETPTHVALYGGEPLLVENYPLVEYIFEKGKLAGSDFYIVTNGTTLDFYSNLFKRHSEIIKGIQVTVDGPKHVHDKKRRFKDGKGTFDVIMNNISTVLESLPGMSISARTNVTTKDSVHDLIGLFEIYEERGFVKSDKFNYYFTPIRESYGGCQTSSCIADDHDFFGHALKILHEKNPYPHRMKWTTNTWQMSLIYKLIQPNMNWTPGHRSCSGGNPGTFVFGPEGDLYACWNDVGNSDRRVGLWYPEWILFDSVKQWRERDVSRIRECRQCKYLFTCRGGCGRLAERRYGQLNSPACNGEEKEKLILHDIVKLVGNQLLEL